MSVNNKAVFQDLFVIEGRPKCQISQCLKLHTSGATKNLTAGSQYIDEGARDDLAWCARQKQMIRPARVVWVTSARLRLRIIIHDWFSVLSSDFRIPSGYANVSSNAFVLRTR